MLTSLAFVFLAGLAAAAVCSAIKLPRIIGMLLVGIVLGPHILNVLDDSILSISSELRQMALIIILLKAGLSLDLSDLRQVGRPAVLLSCLPATCELAGYILLAPYLLGVNRIEAAVMGAVLAAVSPAVVVPRMVFLMENRWGTDKSIPQMLLAMCIVSALGGSLFNLMLAVGLSSTPKFARVVRASVLSTREQEFVEAARAIGAGNLRIIWHHILPNSISPLIVQATLAMAGAIISASALSFLGFGIQAPQPEWGAMLSAGRKYIRTLPYLTVIPGLAIMVVVYALNVVGDGLRDCLDPRLKK